MEDAFCRGSERLQNQIRQLCLDPVCGRVRELCSFTRRQRRPPAKRPSVAILWRFAFFPSQVLPQAGAGDYGKGLGGGRR